MNDTIALQGLEIDCVIGIFDWERKIKQTVSIDFDLRCDMRHAARTDAIEDTIDYKSVAKEIITHVEASRYGLIETMAQKIADICLSRNGVKEAIVTVSKPGAVRGSRNVSVRIARRREATPLYLGFGGNVEPEKHIAAALKMVRQRFDVSAVSNCYRSPAWGVNEPQPDYLNLAIAATTEKDLFAVRAELRWIEELLGRKRTLDKCAPRTVDIDLLLFGDHKIAEPAGTLPHPQLTTQQFVYIPMMEIAPDVTPPGWDRPLRDITPIWADPDMTLRKVDIALA